MTHEQIADYFSLVQRIVKTDGHFFTRNRVEKVPLASNSSILKGSGALYQIDLLNILGMITTKSLYMRLASSANLQKRLIQ